MVIRVLANGNHEKRAETGILLFSSQRQKSALVFCKYAKSLYLCTPYFENHMANHKSAEKRIRANEVKRVRNRYQHKTTRTQIKKLRSLTVKTEAETLLKEVSSMIDKLAKKNVIHWKKAANQKSKLTKFVRKIA